MTAKGRDVTTARLAGGVRQAAPIDMSMAGAIVAVPQEKLDAGDLVFRVATADLRELGIEHGDLLIVEPRSKGNAATAELVLVMLGERAFRRSLVDEGGPACASRSCPPADHRTHRSPGDGRGHRRRARREHPFREVTA